MDSIEDVLAQNLSGGQKRKLTFGIAILGDPQVNKMKFREGLTFLKLKLLVVVPIFYLQRTCVIKYLQWDIVYKNKILTTMPFEI